jgi:hypothetical protein
MDRTLNLAEVVAHEMADYVAQGIYDSDSYLLYDETKQTYSFVSVPRDNPQDSLIVMMARITSDNKIIIETDHTDKPLYQALIDAGVSRSQIIRAYAGQTQPEP